MISKKVGSPLNLAADDDFILIVKNGDKDNLYFVSADFFNGMFGLQRKVNILPSSQHSAILIQL